MTQRKPSESNARYAVRMYVLCVLLPCFAIIAIALTASIAEAAPQRFGNHTDHRCYKAADWGPASQRVRPCVALIGNVPKAGAVRFVVSDADGTVRYSGWVTTPYHHLFSVQVTRLYEDGSFCYNVVNWRGAFTPDCVGALDR